MTRLVLMPTTLDDSRSCVWVCWIINALANHYSNLLIEAIPSPSRMAVLHNSLSACRIDLALASVEEDYERAAVQPLIV